MLLLSQLLLYNDLLVGNQGAAVAAVAALLKRKNDKEKKNISPPFLFCFSAPRFFSFAALSKKTI